jgi:tRNA A37 threonylcarbamoyltransferase TsaD
MEKIFDLAEMRVAADFRWRDDTHYITEGVTPNLTAEVYSEWLEKVIDDIIERREVS